MRRLVLSLVLAVVLAAVSGPPAGTQVPTPPHRFYGAVRINGVPAPDGTVVAARIEPTACGRAVTAGGAYRLDVLAATVRGGCGVEGVPVRFAVNGDAAMETAVWSGATFSALDLTAQAPPFRVATLALDSPCIPPSGAVGCDAARLRLWNGDAAAWAQLFRALDAPPPDPDAVFGEVIRLRLEAGDPALIALFAQRLGWPYLKITAIRFGGTEPGEADEYVEIANLGGGAQTMSGWRLRAGAARAEFRFRPGAVLAPGARCRAYTGVIRADSCAGFGFGSTFVLWDNVADTAQLTVDLPALVADSTRYVSEPSAQPPPPALRGQRMEE